VDPKKQSLLFPEVVGLTLPNPISSDMSVMRVSLLPGLLNALSYNQKRQQSNIKLFETGLIFKPDPEQATGVEQIPMIGGVLTGNTHDEHWSIASTGIDFFDAKASCERLLEFTGAAEEFEFVQTSHAAYHPGQCANILHQGEKVGIVGALHPQHAKPLGFSGKVFAFELAIAAISARKLPWAAPVSKYPVNRRDIAMTVNEALETGKLLKSIEKIGISELVGLNLFDVYQGKGIEPGYKSLAISVWLQSTEKTLEDSDIQKSVDIVVRHLQDQFSATLRD
jgi:phenylalanyl-tRNA synthetase beta chain